MKVYPGQIFVAEHFDIFTRSFKTHMFVCVKTNGLVEDTVFKGSIMGVLITSTERADGILLKKEKNPFLENDSYAIPAAIYTFDINRNDIRILDSIDVDDFRTLITARQKEFGIELAQCMHALVNVTKYRERM